MSVERKKWSLIKSPYVRKGRCRGLVTGGNWGVNLLSRFHWVFQFFYVIGPISQEEIPWALESLPLPWLPQLPPITLASAIPLSSLNHIIIKQLRFILWYRRVPCFSAIAWHPVSRVIAHIIPLIKLPSLLKNTKGYTDAKGHSIDTLFPLCSVLFSHMEF